MLIIYKINYNLRDLLVEWVSAWARSVKDSTVVMTQNFQRDKLEKLLRFRRYKQELWPLRRLVKPSSISLCSHFSSLEIISLLLKEIRYPLFHKNPKLWLRLKTCNCFFLQNKRMHLQIFAISLRSTVTEVKSILFEFKIYKLVEQ